MRNWSYSDIASARDKLSALSETENNIQKKIYICKVLDCVNHYYEFTYSPLLSKKETIKDLISECSLSFFAFGRYHSLIEEFYFGVKHYQNVMFAISNRLEKILGKDEDFSRVCGCIITEEQTISLVQGFFTDFDKDLSLVVSELFESDNFYLNFTDHKKEDNSIESDGNCFYIDILKNYYLSVDKSLGLTKVFNLIHETGHAIDFKLNPTAPYTENTEIACEVASLFPEMVALFENYGNYNDIMVNHELFSLLTTYFEISNALLFHKIIINIYKKYNYKLSPLFYAELRKEYELKMSDIHRFLSHDIQKSGSYVLSFEICCELIYIYFFENDKDKALNIYKKIVNDIHTKDELEVIFSEIPFGEHLKFITRNILKRMINSIKEFKKDEKKNSAKISKLFKK